MSESYRLTFSRNYGLRLGHVRDLKEELPDLTTKIERRILTPIHPGNLTADTIAINGLMGSGKSQYCLYWAWKIEQRYPGLTYTVYADNLEIAYKEIEKMPKSARVLVIIIDDAMEHQSAYNVAAQNKTIAKFYDVRHMMERRLDMPHNGGTGKVFTFINWQRLMSVNKNYRNPDLFAFMSAMLDDADIKKVEGVIGSRGYNALNADMVERRNTGIRKSRIMVRFGDMRKDELNGVGWHNYQYMPTAHPEWMPPKLLRTSEYFAEKDKPTREQMLDELASNPKYAEKVGWLRDLDSGKTQKAIAADSGKAQSTVSEGIASIREMVKDCV